MTETLTVIIEIVEDEIEIVKLSSVLMWKLPVSYYRCLCLMGF